MNKETLRKPMTLMLLIVGGLFALIFGYQIFKAKMIKKYLSQNAQQITTVSATEAIEKNWQPRVTATGSVRAKLGVDITTELAGIVEEIYFKPGERTEKNAPILKLRDNTEMAQLRALQAEAELAQINYDRDKAQFAINAVSQAVLDTDLANLKNQTAQVAQQLSTVAKKNIRAPFSGKLGICLVYPGQYIVPGDKIVSLQQLDPIYVDFYLPQQELVRIKTGQAIKFTTDTYPEVVFSGKITTIDPQIEVSTRNIRIEATLNNPKELLLPGMFGYVEIDTGKVDQYITVPQNAISFNSYGEIVYLVKEDGKDKKGNPKYIAKQSFIEVGETRDNEIAVKKGIEKGDWVVTSGQMKLKNGSPVVIDNKLFKNEKDFNNKNSNLSNEIDKSETKD